MNCSRFGLKEWAEMESDNSYVISVATLARVDQMTQPGKIPKNIAARSLRIKNHENLHFGRNVIITN